MRYAASLIGGPSTLATFVAVYALFGPTFPGIYDKERGVYTLFYPGLSFAFPIPSQYTDCCHDGEAELPLEFPDGTTPVTCRVSIYDSSTDSKVGVGSLMDKASAPSLPSGSLYMEEVHVKLGEELSFSVGGQHIPFGASPQDVWTELGHPCGIHQKQVDQMVIHSASDPRPRTTLCGDYFYNYFTRGLDILFDGQAHKIKKFVLHSNYPGHADFNSYIKCNFVIYSSDFGGSFHQEVNTSNRCITPSTKWEQVKFILRRTNALLSNHLPPKIVEVVCCKLTPLQSELYNHFVHSENVKRAITEEIKQSKILAYITALKKLCNHPKLIYDTIKSGSPGMSGFEDCLRFFPAEMFSGRSGSWTGGDGSWVELSEKMHVLARLLAQLRQRTDDRIVLVSNYTQTLDLFAQLCRETRYPLLRLDGTTSISKRQKLVNRFNDQSKDEFVFLLTSKAGGCGLNLIGGNRLILFDPDWNPANDKQAAPRVWRDEQKKCVYLPIFEYWNN